MASLNSIVENTTQSHVTIYWRLSRLVAFKARAYGHQYWGPGWNAPLGKSSYLANLSMLGQCSKSYWLTSVQITCVRSSQGFDWNPGRWLPYSFTNLRADMVLRNIPSILCGVWLRITRTQTRSGPRDNTKRRGDQANVPTMIHTLIGVFNHIAQVWERRDLHMGRWIWT